ncbi:MULTISPECIES: hypothetical protein [unclassified Pseudomonas]|uniref:hypothetical protein n=1 Tax=unclassified Pseudomonas TaxID=196821 RepID=UPI000C87B5D1|nr:MULTISPECIES: hypothetical protein [unclassified Pseudomonas]PMU87103.1 hypothetical protein C1Y30_23395 [Pseudomonas sp. GW704-F3]PMU91433.1 hypothetical protein C1Y28_23205 [Pseudomonas sp. GW704-F5]PMV01233.1 hypothetical protein C1Y29_20165 [Pseudomonas sp. MPBD4-3]PMV25777.1 hypothetical protein C1Y27_23790 [Pseudomonas sp. GW704-F2]
METKHTPEPWLIQESTVYALNERRPPVNRFHASVDSGFDNCDKRISREEVCANAKLIAAAPDLLKALERCELLLRSKRRACEDSNLCHLLDSHISQARNAINKATA